MKLITWKCYILFLFLILKSASLASQVTDPYQTGYTAQKNLDAIARINPYSIGGMGFDTRYEGVKGSPMWFGELNPALVKINTEEKYIKINSDLDAYQNRLIFTHPATGKLLTIPTQIIDEVLITVKGDVVVFRTTKDKKFDPPVDKIRFCQVLYSNRSTILKIAFKKLIEADYKRAYSSDRRYDEYDTQYNYYYSGTDFVFHKIPPTKKSLVTIFPDKKKIIESAIGEKNYEDNDEMILRVLKKIAASDSVK